MADIIVTVPKDQTWHFMNDKVPSIDAWWYVRCKPKNLQPGDWIGFVFDGAIRYAATVTMIFPGDRWEVHFEDCGFIKPIPNVHFQGYRYFDLKEQVQEADDESA